MGTFISGFALGFISLLALEGAAVYYIIIRDKKEEKDNFAG